MKENILFQTFTPKGGKRLEEQIGELKGMLREWLMSEGLSPASMVQARVYLTDVANQWSAVVNSPLYACYLSAAALSYVEQPLLTGAKVGLQVWCIRSMDLKKIGTPNKLIVETGGLRYLFHSVRFADADVQGLDAEAQTRKAFLEHIEWLKQEGMSLSKHCHRTWIYVRDIDCNYAGVVEGRNKIFEEEGLTAETHFIASTGIGGCALSKQALVSIDFFSVDGLSENKVDYLHALDYLNPTHEYGVAFERGTRLCLPEGDLLFISGTASINNKGECLYHGDVLAQTERLFLNIDKLLADKGAALAHLKYIIVYLRDVADARVVEAYLQEKFPSLPYLLTEARVCRPEWLIEVEGIALRSHV